MLAPQIPTLGCYANTPTPWADAGRVEVAVAFPPGPRFPAVGTVSRRRPSPPIPSLNRLLSRPSARISGSASLARSLTQTLHSPLLPPLPPLTPPPSSRQIPIPKLWSIGDRPPHFPISHANFVAHPPLALSSHHLGSFLTIYLIPAGFPAFTFQGFHEP
ncbi:hypothetical protein FDECE_5502 [Fusarium decemcellulare]|nr:hypothetical protein FDECE_5502 [Fusarium decemcellulare]